MRSVSSHCTVDTRIDTCALHNRFFTQVRVPEKGISLDPQHLELLKLIKVLCVVDLGVIAARAADVDVDAVGGDADDAEDMVVSVVVVGLDMSNAAFGSPLWGHLRLCCARSFGLTFFCSEHASLLEIIGDKPSIQVVNDNNC